MMILSYALSDGINPCGNHFCQVPVIKNRHASNLEPHYFRSCEHFCRYKPYLQNVQK